MKLWKYSKHAASIANILNKITRKKIFVVNAAEAIFVGIKDTCEFISSFESIADIEETFCVNGMLREIYMLFINDIHKEVINSTKHMSVTCRCKLINVPVIMSQDLNRGNVYDIVINKKDEAAFLSETCFAFWDKFSNHVMISKGRGDKYSEYASSRLCVSKDEEINGFYSKAFFDSYDYIKAFNNQGLNRSLIFYGKPGVGKSTMIKQLSQKFGYKTIRFHNDVFKTITLDELSEIIKLLKPECLIIDDFDRVAISSTLLSTFEMLNKKLKLIMVSVNSLSYFDKNQALIRPQRFDEFIKVDCLGDAVIEKIIGKENMDLRDKIKDFPASFIQELKNIIDVMGKGDVDKYIEKLQKRVNKQNEEAGEIAPTVPMITKEIDDD